MATIDTTRWANPAPHEVEEPGSSLKELFGRRNARSNAWYLETAWMRAAISAPEQDETIIRHDEVTLKAVSMAAGRVKVALTDEMAEQVKRIVGGQ
jgi:hypothetical protein